MRGAEEEGEEQNGKAKKANRGARKAKERDEKDNSPHSLSIMYNLLTVYALLYKIFFCVVGINNFPI